MIREQKPVETIESVDEALIASEENLVIDVQFLIQEMMNERGLTRADLARMTGVSKARLTQMMRSDSNPTLRTLAKIFHVLGDRLCVMRESECITKPISDFISSEQSTWDMDDRMFTVKIASHAQLSRWATSEIRLRSSQFDAVNENNISENQELDIAAVA